MKNQLTSLILCSLILLLSISVLAQNDTSGICGTNLKWNLENGVLKITGTGDMYDYKTLGSKQTPPPWHNMDIYSVEIGEGVTGIGSCAFYKCEELSKVTFSNTVVSIGDHAFTGCTNLASLDLPDSIISIKEKAFESCRNLTKVKFSKNLTNIGKDSFMHCVSLTSVEIPSGVISISRNAFRDCKSLTKLKIQSGVTNIGENAFYECEKLNTVIIPISVTGIGKESFYICKEIKDVYYEGTESDWASISIGDKNHKLTDATIHYGSYINKADEAQKEEQKNSDNTANVVIDGQNLVTDQPATIVNGRTLVPLRAIFEVFGFDVQWIGETQTVIAKKDGITITLSIDNTTAYVNDEEKVLDVPATIINGRTFVPVRFISESVGAIVNWVAESRLVQITSN